MGIYEEKGVFQDFFYRHTSSRVYKLFSYCQYFYNWCIWYHLWRTLWFWVSYRLLDYLSRKGVSWETSIILCKAFSRFCRNHAFLFRASQMATYRRSSFIFWILWKPLKLASMWKCASHFSRYRVSQCQEISRCSRRSKYHVSISHIVFWNLHVLYAGKKRLVFYNRTYSVRTFFDDCLHIFS